ncbi:MAG: EamA family transporter [Anaerolineales bacterium]
MSKPRPIAPPLNHGYAIALASAAILSLTGIFIRHLTETYRLPALVLAVWRDAFVVLTLLPILGLVRPALMRIERRHLPFLIGYGFVLAVFNALWTLSVALNGAAVATVLVYCSAAFTALLARWLLNEPLTLPKLAAVVLILAGCVMVSDALNAAAWTLNPVGLLSGILSGLGYAAYSLMGRTASERGLNPWTSLLYTFGGAALFLILFNFFPGPLIPGTIDRPADFFWLGKAWSGWGILLLLAAGPTLAGFGLYNVSLRLLPASIANLIVSSEPVFTALIAYAWLEERLTWLQIGGSLLILSGVLLLRFYEARPGRAAPSPVSQP